MESWCDSAFVALFWRISIITYYEIVSGLKHRDAQKQLTSFLEFASYNVVLPLIIESTTISGDIYASLRKKGTRKSV